MSQIEGFVSVGTGGQVNAATASGTVYGLLPGQATAAVPTGWVGGFSGCIGLLGAGVAGVKRVATGLYVVKLEDDWVRCDSVQLTTFNTGTAVDYTILENTVGYGNSIATGGMTALQSSGNNPKNEIFIQFYSSGQVLAQDIGSGGGFYLDIRVRDSLSGPQ
jgi:hypothetical protein